MIRAVLVGAAGVGFAVALVFAGSAEQAGALSTPTPNPPVTCPADLRIDALPEDASLAIEHLTAIVTVSAVDSAYEDVQLKWDRLSLNMGCIAVYRDGNNSQRPPGDGPEALLGPQVDSWRDYALHASGDTCYRVVGVGEDRRGPTASVCVAVAAADHGAVSPSNFSRLAGVALVAVVLAPLGLLVRRWWMGRRDG